MAFQVMYPIASEDRIVYTTQEVREVPKVGLRISVFWNGKYEGRIITSIEEGILYTKKYR